MKYVIGMDVGGTHIRVGAVREDGRLQGLRKLLQKELLGETPVQNLVELVKEIVREQAGLGTPSALVVGLPAVLDRDRKIIWNAPNLHGLDGEETYRSFAEAFPFPVYFEKDVNLLFEYDRERYGLERQEVAVGCYIGTGVGNAIAINGQILTGASGAAGELGHVPVWGNGELCSCGNVGCIEPKAGGKYLQDLCRQCFPKTCLSRLFVEHANHPRVEQYLEYVACAVAAEINILDPGVVLLGGGVISMDRFPKEKLVRLIQAHVRKPFPHHNVSYIFSEDQGENGVRGAGIYGLKRAKGAKV